MALVVKNLFISAGDVRDSGSIPRSGRSPGEGNSKPLQYSCLENPMDRGGWWAAVHVVANSDVTARTRTCTHTHTHPLGEKGLDHIVCIKLTL